MMLTTIKTMKPTKRIRVFYKTNGRCAYCGCELSLDNFEVAHIIPQHLFNSYPNLSQYSRDNIDNLYPTCHSCNRFKAYMSLEDFRRKIENCNNHLMQSDASYRMAIKYGLIRPVFGKVVFYFEQL